MRQAESSSDRWGKLSVCCAIAVLSLVTVTACSNQRAGSSSTPIAQTSPAVTRLEQPTTVAMTELKASQPSESTTTLETSKPAQTTVTAVQKTLSDLNAEKTGEGIRINLPENILFDFDKSDIRPGAKPTLAKLSNVLRYYGKAPTSIYGYTDSKGSDAYNQSLSRRRAEAVKAYLVQNFGVRSSRLGTEGFGESKPVGANANPDGSDNPAGRQKNRRVEVIIRNQGGGAQ